MVQQTAVSGALGPWLLLYSVTEGSISARVKRAARIAQPRPRPPSYLCSAELVATSDLLRRRE